MRTKLRSSVTAEMKQEIRTDITKRVNTAGSGQLRTLEQVKLHWKNLKQKATKDHSEAQKPKTGNKPNKWGEFTDIILDIIGGERSQALHCIQSVSQGGESGLYATESTTTETTSPDPKMANELGERESFI